MSSSILQLSALCYNSGDNMKYLIVGLGNPGEEYEATRHNAGRLAVEAIRKQFGFPDWTLDKKFFALKSEGKYEGQTVTLLMPETMMNRSGKSLAGLIKSAKDTERLLVIHDDIDLPFGRFKISFNRGSGGHRGLESIIKTIKTTAFLRVRIGVSPIGKKGMAKKPIGEEAIVKYILGRFRPAELVAVKRLAKEIAAAAALWLTAGLAAAMNKFN